MQLLNSASATLDDLHPESPVVEAVFRTLLYADVFSFPMTAPEIHHYLIGESATLDEIQSALSQSAWLSTRLVHTNDYYAVKGRDENVALRLRRDTASRELWPLAIRYGAILAHLPFIRMVALTGALAVRNASASRDDIDYLLVTAPGRVWIARALAVVVVRLVRLARVGLCPNYVLAETALVQDRQDLFTAHELAQMVPLSGFALYESMRAANTWADAFLPNAVGSFYREPDRKPRGMGHLIQRFGEFLFGGAVGNALERWEQRRKLRKFDRELRKSGSAAQLDDARVKGHFNDYGYPALHDYEQRLVAYKLTTSAPAVSEQMPGR